MIPEAFLIRMRALLGDEYEAFLTSLEESSVRALRVNTLKAEASTVMDALDTELLPLPYADDGYVFSYEKIGNHPLHHAGGFYVQDPGAMATLHALPVQKGWIVADFCAAPGGKTSQLSACVGEDGVVLSNEIDRTRVKILRGNLERLGARNVVLMNTDASSIASLYPRCFDLVLVDAPCSGEGMFRKYEIAREDWSVGKVNTCAALESDILSSASKTVKGGGYLLYSTCTFSLEENEKNIDDFLEQNPDFEIVEVSKQVQAVTSRGIAFEGSRHPEALRLTRRFYPHRSQGEGQYIALMRRSENAPISEPPRDASEPLSRKEWEITDDFLRETLNKDAHVSLRESLKLVKYKDTVYAATKLPIPSRGVYMPGTALGTITKGRFVPHHHFFSAFGHLFVRKEELSADSDAIRRYLRGETVASSLENGYGVVTVFGCALGGIKVVDGVAKNHYPKGLRIP